MGRLRETACIGVSTNNVPQQSGRLRCTSNVHKLIFRVNMFTRAVTARASNVVRFLQENVAIDPTRLEAVGLSEFHPVAGNATAQGRSQNRRIEIALLPDLREAPKVAQ
jgi:hypothetical protein